VGLKIVHRQQHDALPVLVEVLFQRRLPTIGDAADAIDWLLVLEGLKAMHRVGRVGDHLATFDVEGILALLPIAGVTVLLDEQGSETAPAAECRSEAAQVIKF
jgi:hypothetical protein